MSKPEAKVFREKCGEKLGQIPDRRTSSATKPLNNSRECEIFHAGSAIPPGHVQTAESIYNPEPALNHNQPATHTALSGAEIIILHNGKEQK